ncbi:MAG: D-2-hydroxyacid dehydrogenase [Planctomycetota bacterium]|jgi:glycerate dehydrogenase|nr:D-2-hydroxyacid dehydrogenase [Planctomycetota bacterium]MDA1201014.1 D-2-hydroxyacid dehydrogenase [Planctomycetota bacterium]
MRIVILDAYTTNPGDLDWEPVAALGDLTTYDRTPGDQIIARAARAGAVLTNKTPLAAATLAALPDLKYVGVLATGVNVVDVAAARAAGVTVTNVPAYSTPGVAQAVFALLLELTNQVGRLSAAVHAGRWQSCDDFCFWDGELVELDGLTLGIIGYGDIGRRTAAIGQALGMDVVAASRSRQPGSEEGGVRFLTIDEVFAQADVVSLHCPLAPETQGLVNADRLAAMKPTAYLINTARGGLVDEQALADALASGRIAGAGLDVVAHEPPRDGSPLCGLANCVITPHVAWATRKARARLIEAAAANLAAFQAGSPRNVVS